MYNYCWPFFPLLPLLHYPNGCEDLDSIAVCPFCILPLKGRGPKGPQGLTTLLMVIQTWAPDPGIIWKSSSCCIVKNSIGQWTKLGDYSQIFVSIESPSLPSWQSLPCKDLFSTLPPPLPIKNMLVCVNSPLASWFEELRLSTNRIKFFILAFWDSLRATAVLTTEVVLSVTSAIHFCFQGLGKGQLDCSLLSLYTT